MATASFEFLLHRCLLGDLNTRLEWGWSGGQRLRAWVRDQTWFMHRIPRREELVERCAEAVSFTVSNPGAHLESHFDDLLLEIEEKRPRRHVIASIRWEIVEATSVNFLEGDTWYRLYLRLRRKEVTR